MVDDDLHELLEENWIEKRGLSNQLTWWWGFHVPL
jgi:hypothetical protein